MARASAPTSDVLVAPFTGWETVVTFSTLMRASATSAARRASSSARRASPFTDATFLQIKSSVDGAYASLHPSTLSRREVTIFFSCSHEYGANAARLLPNRDAMRGSMRSGTSSVLAMPMTTSRLFLCVGQSNMLYKTS